MPKDELDLFKSTFDRWLRGEPLSISDAERWITAITRIPMQLSSPENDQVQAMLAKFREGLRATYLNPQQ